MDYDLLNMSKVTISNVFMVLGILFLLSGMGSTVNGGSDNSFGFVTGVNFLLGAIAINARKKQSPTESNKWFVVSEIVAILIFLLTTIPSLFNGRWYLHPISFTFVPIIITTGYLYTWYKFKKSSIRG